MNSKSYIQDFKPYHVEEISINSRETNELLSNINRSNMDNSYNISNSWQLLNAYRIQNLTFERAFNDKREEIQDEAFYQDHWDVKLGYLTTFHKDSIDVLAEEGLEIKSFPKNYLGHNVCGLHISMNADICLNEAKGKLGDGKEVTLLIFKYMIGRRKMVAMYDPKILLAPSPKFDSHVCEERPVPKEKCISQYIKSLIYLYEFANDNYDPVIRPRHCCPIGALTFKSTCNLEILDLTESESIDASLYNSNSGRKISMNQNTPNTMWINSFQNIDDITETNNINPSSWKPINFQEQSQKASGESMLLKPRGIDFGPILPWQEDKPERSRKWKEGAISVYGGVKYNKLLSNRIGKTF